MRSRSKKLTGDKDRRFLILFYPHSGRKRLACCRQDRIKKFFEEKKQPYLFYEIKKDISELNFDDLRRKFEFNRIVIAGGDGTLRRILEYFYWHQEQGKNKYLAEIPFSFIPGGSANVFAHSLGIPSGLDKALESCLGGRSFKVDVGLVDKKYLFLIAACFGKISNVSLGPSRSLKERYGFFSYVLEVIKILGRFKKYSFSFKKEGFPEEVKEANSAMVCNHLNVHFLKPARSTLPDDGLLDLFIFTNSSVWGFLKAWFDFYFSKKDTRQLGHRQFSKITLDVSNFPQRANLDGSYVQLSGPRILVEAAPRKVTFVN